MGRFTNKQLLPTLATALGLSLGRAAALAEEAEPGVRPRWAFAAVDPGASKPAPVERDTRKPSGSRLKFLIEPLCDCSVYLFYQDSGEAIHLLDPESLGRAPKGEVTYVPPGEHWFELDAQTGLGTFSCSPRSSPSPLLSGSSPHTPPLRGGILISERTQELLEGAVETRRLEPIRVKGLDDPLTVYEVAVG